jgi:hypothetical protein
MSDLCDLIRISQLKREARRNRRAFIGATIIAAIQAAIIAGLLWRMVRP